MTWRARSWSCWPESRRRARRRPPSNAASRRTRSRATPAASRRRPASGSVSWSGATASPLGSEEPHEPLRADPVIEAQQKERIAKLRAWRVGDNVAAALADLRSAAEGADNVLHPMKEALRVGSTIGEVCDVLRETWGGTARRSGDDGIRHAMPDCQNFARVYAICPMPAALPTVRAWTTTSLASTMSATSWRT